MHISVLRPNVAYYYRRVLANAELCAREWGVGVLALSIYLGQSATCKGIRNNYEVRAFGQQRAYNGANHKPDGEHGDTGYDEHELAGPYSFTEIEAMMRACPDDHGRH